MHLTFGNLVLYTPLYRLMERKNVSMYETCGTVGAKIGYVLVLLVNGQVVVEFGRKVFLVVFYYENH